MSTVYRTSSCGLGARFDLVYGPEGIAPGNGEMKDRPTSGG
jgi:hypothetical protein